MSAIINQEIISKMTLEEKCQMLSGKDIWHTKEFPHLGIPGITLSDGPHGIRKQESAGDHLGLNASVPATCFPTAATVANSWDPKLGEELGRYLGEEAASQGVNMLLGPGVNIKRSPLCGRNFEYFSEDPYLSGKMAAGYIRGIQKNGVSACLKHYAVNSQETRRMASDSVVDERTLREIYLTAFEIAVKEAAPHGIMTSYNRVNGVYANENPYLLQDILRAEWGFSGCVVSDWGGSNDHTAGVLAGSHMEMPGTGGDSDRTLADAVKAGIVPEKWLDTMVDEILSTVLKTSKAIEKQKGKPFDIAAHHKAAEYIAQQSIVLLKNEEHILPLAKGTRVTLIGDFAETPRYQGAGSSVVNPARVDSIKDLIQDYDLECVGYAKGYHRTGPPDSMLESEATEQARRADAVLLCIGLNEMAEAEGLDRQHMRIPENQIRLLQRLWEVNQKIVVILSAGSPVEMPWLDQCKALVHGYLGGQAGAAAQLKVVTGQVNPSGKLAESYPLRYEDVPSALYFPGRERTAEYREGIYVGYRYYDTAGIPVQFPFGFGLSYTTFAYSGLAVSTKEAVFTMTNTGETDGAEIVQLYISSKGGQVFGPAKELKGFSKVFLKARESRKVTIPLDEYAFRYYNIKTGRFETEGGRYDILIGASAEDIRLRDSVFLVGTGAPLPYEEKRLRSYYSGKVATVSDEEFEVLLGHPIPDAHWDNSRLLDMNDTLSQLYYAKSPLARLAYRVMTSLLKKSETAGKPDLNLLFIYQLPFRGIAKMTGGRITMEMAEGICIMVNGHLFKGLGKIAAGFLYSRRYRKGQKGGRGGDL